MGCATESFRTSTTTGEIMRQSLSTFLALTALLSGCSSDEEGSPRPPVSCACPQGTVCDTRGDCVDPCPDDDACATCEACHAGRCTPAACKCTVDGDCDDGDFCNGEETCGADDRCADGSPIDCPPATNSCFDNACDQDTNACVLESNQSCSCGGAAECDDGLDCNGAELCESGSCAPGTAFDCPSTAVVCQRNVCNETGGDPVCLLEPNAGGECDDGTPCTDAVCNTAGTCVPSPVDCDDGIPCTTDWCDPTPDVCVNDPDHGSCDDGVGCTVDTCDLSTGCTNVPDDIVCNDGHGCTADTCDPDNDCQNTPLDEGESCADGACTLAGECVAGNCVATSVADDFTVCNTDSLCMNGQCWLHDSYTFDPGTSCDESVSPEGAVVWAGRAEVAVQIYRRQATEPACPNLNRALVLRPTPGGPPVIAVDVPEANIYELSEYLVGYGIGAPLLGVRNGDGFAVSGTPIHAALPSNLSQIETTNSVTLCNNPCDPSDQTTFTTFGGRHNDAGTWRGRVFSCLFDPGPVCNVEHLDNASHRVVWGALAIATAVGGSQQYGGLLVSTDPQTSSDQGVVFADGDLSHTMDPAIVMTNSTSVQILGLPPDRALLYSTTQLWLCDSPPTWSCSSPFSINSRGANSATLSQSGDIVLAQLQQVSILPAGSDPTATGEWRTVTIPNGYASHAAMTDTALYAFGRETFPDNTSILQIWSFVAP